MVCWRFTLNVTRTMRAGKGGGGSKAINTILFQEYSLCCRFSPNRADDAFTSVVSAFFSVCDVGFFLNVVNFSSVDLHCEGRRLSYPDGYGRCRMIFFLPRFYLCPFLLLTVTVL